MSTTQDVTSTVVLCVALVYLAVALGTVAYAVRLHLADEAGETAESPHDLDRTGSDVTGPADWTTEPRPAEVADERNVMSGNR